MTDEPTTSTDEPTSRDLWRQALLASLGAFMAMTAVWSLFADVFITLFSLILSTFTALYVVGFVVKIVALVVGIMLLRKHIPALNLASVLGLVALALSGFGAMTWVSALFAPQFQVADFGMGNLLQIAIWFVLGAWLMKVAVVKARTSAG